MGIATFLLYFIIDVPDSSRRIWYYRRAPMILTLTVGCLGGGILSEVVQGYLPYKTFQYSDIIANLLGSTIAYLIAHTILLHSRQRAQLSRLYLPISSESSTPYPSRVRSESMDTEMGAWEYQHHVSGPGGEQETGKPYAGSRAFALGDDEDEVSESRR
ncbi:hypothetical protein QFC20_003435 [Naganishia adeliensis]|uniref:Uncharacterized protein n=1 Tax=Naganishia adeliensis TaxID=92952 RepID=A0ACC2WBB8_9TREE|nr:hypothetical protein QFC20_003435 [Naganishia adeliensis]